MSWRQCGRAGSQPTLLCSETVLTRSVCYIIILNVWNSIADFSFLYFSFCELKRRSETKQHSAVLVSRRVRLYFIKVLKLVLSDKVMFLLFVWWRLTTARIIHSNLWPPRSETTTCQTGTMCSVVEKSIHCVTVQFILSTIHHPTLVLIASAFWYMR